LRAIDFRKELNPEQFAAATAPDGPLLILAAAGTGKTRTLVYRVAYLVEQGVPAERILLLTFTNRAAREMLERVGQLLGHSAGVSWSGTFHHIANRLLRRYAHLIGYRPDYTILDRDDSRTLMGNCVKELKLHAKEFPKKEVLLALAGKAANMQRGFDDVVDAHFGEMEVDTGAVVRTLERYVERKQGLHTMDFDDLLVKCLELLDRHPTVAAHWQEHFRHVLVDEYQDTNTIQAQLVDCLAGRHRNLFVVGDDFQSIYSWRGADYRNIIFFRERYPDAVMFKIETNYRSVPEVLDVANTTVALADHPEEFKRTLRATRKAFHRPRVARLRDGQHQARYVVDLLAELRRDGYRASDIAILYRAHFHAMELQMELTRARVPHVITSGVRFFEQAHVKDVLALLRTLQSPEDELAFSRLLMLMPGVGERTATKVWQALGRRFDAGQADARGRVAELLRPQSRARWLALLPLLEAYHTEQLAADPGEAIERFLEDFYAQYAVDTFDNAETRIEDIGELARNTARFTNVEQFLSDVALLTNLDAEPDRPDASGQESIRLSTVHQAKGLEWPVVILLWMAEGLFPSSRSMNESAEGEAEERRLFYVAATRARDVLVMCVPEVRRMRDGGVFYCQPSRFVNELPPSQVSTSKIPFLG
jgi:DNA helicase II / ATP-dependent DNA helicase PcrA